MARVREITSRGELSPEHGGIFDAIAESRGRVGGPFSVLLNSPEVAGRTAHLGSYIRFESTLSPAERELAILTTSRELDCGYEWAGHASLALDAGVSRETIDLIAGGGPLEELGESEALIVGYGRELLRGHRVSEETFAAAKASFGDRGVTELTATMGYYAMLACALNALEVIPADGAPKLP